MELVGIFCSHWEETCSDLWEQWGRKRWSWLSVLFWKNRMGKQRHPRSDVKMCSQQLSATTKNMCPIVAPFTGVSALIIFCLDIIFRNFFKKFFSALSATFQKYVIAYLDKKYYFPVFLANFVVFRCNFVLLHFILTWYKMWSVSHLILFYRYLFDIFKSSKFMCLYPW